MVRLVVALAVLLAALPARAQDVAPPTEETAALEARTLFEQAVRMSREERWAEALDLFRRSGALVPRPSTLFNVAIALDRLGRPRESIAAIDEYLAISDPTGDEADRHEAMRLRVEAEARVAHLTVSVGAPGATIELDGTPIEADTEVLVDPGDHVLVASASGRRSARVALTLAPGARVERRIELVPEAATAIAGGEQDRAPPGSTSLLEDPIFWGIVGGVVLVGIGVGVGVGVATQSPQPYGGSTGLAFEIP